jgi:hypothetical protein
VAHPEGERCLVVTSRGSTISRRRNGSILHRFPSRLPNGATPARPRTHRPGPGLGALRQDSKPRLAR